MLDASLRAMGIAGTRLTEVRRCATPGHIGRFTSRPGASVCAHCRPVTRTPPLGVVGLMSALYDGLGGRRAARNRPAAMSGWIEAAHEKLSKTRCA